MHFVASDWNRNVSTSLFKFKLFIKPEAKSYFVIHRHNLVNINTFLFMPECHYHVIGWDILWEDFQSSMLTYNKQLLSAMDGMLWSSFNSRHHCQSLLQHEWIGGGGGWRSDWQWWLLTTANNPFIIIIHLLRLLEWMMTMRRKSG